MTTSELIACLRERHANDNLPPPVSAQEIARAEGLIGIPMPPLLKALYGELSNGRFGPLAMPLFTPTPHLPPFKGDVDGAIDLYLHYRKDSLDSEFGGDERDAEVFGDDARFWPPLLIPFCEWGCFAQSCVDCSTPELPVILSKGMSNKFRPEAPSLMPWFIDWIRGEEAFFKSHEHF